MLCFRSILHLHSTSKAFKELIELQLKIIQVITLISNQFKNLQINSRTRTNTIRAKKSKILYSML